MARNALLAENAEHGRLVAPKSARPAGRPPLCTDGWRSSHGRLADLQPETFRAEEYTLDILLSSMKQGEAVAKSDLRELKLTLGECRKLINQLKASK